MQLTSKNWNLAFRPRHVVAALALLVMLFAARSAAAYPWMNRHGYEGCATCHLDPSGGGLLTEYGRAQSVLVLSSRYTSAEEAEPGRKKDFLFGLVPSSDALLLGGWVRGGALASASGGRFVDERILLMRADAAVGLRIGALRAAGSLGAATAEGARLSQLAQVTRFEGSTNVVSREHWAGATLGEDDQWLVRGGRIAMPFGLRSPEHTSFARAETRTDTNQGQTHGAAVAYQRSGIRAEAMIALGNFQVRPDAFRERGVAAFAEWSPSPKVAIGTSALVLRAESDLGTRRQKLRQAYGPFLRYAPSQTVAVLAEADALVDADEGRAVSAGITTFTQADFEVVRGLHLAATAETLRSPREGSPFTVGGWASALWFFYAHFDARVDAIARTTFEGSPSTLTFLFQIHAYL